MRKSSLNILFKEKIYTDQIQKVAGIEIKNLLGAVPKDFILTRVFVDTEKFDIAVIHPLAVGFNEWVQQRKHSFVALRVTTGSGVSFQHKHIALKEEPLRIVLAVRRMSSINEADVWNACLLASTADYLAIAENRWSDVSKAAEPMLRLFIERSHASALPTIRILCLAFIEAKSQAKAENTSAYNFLKRVESPQYWLEILGSLYVFSESGKTPWRELVKNKKNSAIDALKDQIKFESHCGKNSSLEGIAALISDIVNAKEITLLKVEIAAEECLILIG